MLKPEIVLRQYAEMGKKPIEYSAVPVKDIGENKTNGYRCRNIGKEIHHLKEPPSLCQLKQQLSGNQAENQIYRQGHEHDQYRIKQ